MGFGPSSVVVKCQCFDGLLVPWMRKFVRLGYNGAYKSHAVPALYFRGEDLSGSGNLSLLHGASIFEIVEHNQRKKRPGRAKRPAGNDVGREMNAKVKATETDQEGQKSGKGKEEDLGLPAR
jgi:hypothetical protein